MSNSINFKDSSSKRFWRKIGFHNRFQKNQSCIVYDITKERKYIKSLINSSWILDDELLRNVADRLQNTIKNFNSLTCSPRLNCLEFPSNLPLEVFTQVRTSLANIEDCIIGEPCIIGLGDLLLTCIGDKQKKSQVSFCFYHLSILTYVSFCVTGDCSLFSGFNCSSIKVCQSILANLVNIFSDALQTQMLSIFLFRPRCQWQFMVLLDLKN